MVQPTVSSILDAAQGLTALMPAILQKSKKTSAAAIPAATAQFAIPAPPPKPLETEFLFVTFSFRDTVTLIPVVKKMIDQQKKCLILALGPSAKMVPECLSTYTIYKLPSISTQHLISGIDCPFQVNLLKYFSQRATPPKLACCVTLLDSQKRLNIAAEVKGYVDEMFFVPSTLQDTFEEHYRAIKS